MPKIRIKEIDGTLENLAVALVNTVYIPGLATVACNPVLCQTEQQLKNLPNLDSTSMAYRVALHLIKTYGIDVLYEGFTSDAGPDAGTWENLADKSLYDIRFITAGDFIDKDLNQAMIDCAAKRGDCVALLDHSSTLGAPVEGTKDYILLTHKPSDFDASDTSYRKIGTTYYSLATSAVTRAPSWRENHFYSLPDGSLDYQLLAEKPQDWESNYGAYYKKVTTYLTKSEVGQTGWVWETGKFYTEVPNHSRNDISKIRDYFDGLTKGEYGAAFTPWFKSKDKNLRGSSESVEIPASYGYLFAYGRSIKTYAEWESVAGSYRGIIDEIDEPLRKYSNAECEILQARGPDFEVDLQDNGAYDPNDNVGISINPIAYVRPFGYIIWGGRTAVNNNGALKATSFLNVRNMVSSIKKSLYNAARKYTFELNTDILWAKFKNDVTPLLDQMQTGNGLAGYRFRLIPTNRKSRVTATLTIVPIEPAEDFDLIVELTDSLTISE